MTNTPLRIRTWYYQHFDADYALDVPEEGFEGWKQEVLEFSCRQTALVIMHAWDCGTFDQFPGWHRCVPYIPRAAEIAREVFPPLLRVVRNSPMPVFHVVAGGEYYKSTPGYLRAVALAGPSPNPLEKIAPEPHLEKLQTFRRDHVHPGAHNLEDVKRGFERLDFAPEARPLDQEGVAENGDQLFSLCKEAGVNHLVYCGFAINWCLLLSPGGMRDMQQRGLLCSALRQATTAVESKETAETELCKETGLWRVALLYGFVFDVDDFMQALAAYPAPT
mgnify:CR=1 FL=1